MAKVHVLTSLCLLLALLCVGLQAIPSPRLLPPEIIHPSARIFDPVQLQESSRADSAHGFDVQNYVINLGINDQTHQITGSVQATVEAEENISSISYELVGLTVSAAEVNGSPTTFTQTDGAVSINLGAIPAGQTFQTKVYYSGTPILSPNPYRAGMIFATGSIHTISDPDAARYWWPCYDHPWDKATVQLHITIRDDWKVASNGTLLASSDNNNGTYTYSWNSGDPMTTYLVSIACAPYLIYEQTALNGSLPVRNYAIQSQYNNAVADLAQLPNMIDYFSTLFGPYPFEKYGNAIVPNSVYGAMEHQTMTTLSSFLINGNGTYEVTIAHELAHQWYGDAVSFLTFKDVWLSEGFATYSEHLWTDYRFGWPSAVAYVSSSYHDYYINWENAYGLTPRIYDPAFADYFAPPSYEKAASTLHMLRLKLGDPLFFLLLNQWFIQNCHGNVTTAEFQALAESISGQDLEQFFQQWIFGRGIPSLEYTIWSGFGNPAYNTKIVAKTTSPTATQFWIDTVFKIPGTAADSLFVQASPTGTVNNFNVSTIMDWDLCSSQVESNVNHWTLLRGSTYKKPNITQCLSSNAAVMLTWDAFNEAGVIGYNVYRQPAGYPFPHLWSRLNPTPLTTLSYHDATAQNGMDYDYVIRAVDAEGYETWNSNLVSASPQAFSFVHDLLVVNETRNGNGASISPTDAMVDAFYDSAIEPIIHDNYDADSQGIPSLGLLGDYKVVLWHSDDFSQIQILNALDELGGYLLGGGKLIISGWKTASVFSESFLQSFAGAPGLVYDNVACLISAESDNYADLIVDTTKLTPTWNNMLPMIYTFPEAEDVYHTAQMPPTASGAGNPISFRHENLVLFGMPLYFMEADGVRDFLQDLIPQLISGTDSAEEVGVVIAPSLSSYPNPFNPLTTISFSLPEASPVKLELYNLRGQKVKNLVQTELSRGTHQLAFDGRDESGRALSSGIYLLRLNCAGTQLIRKITLMK
ncbi:MAG: M1 family aminopeptidase [Candidatus Cloacimonadota bacterium]